MRVSVDRQLCTGHAECVDLVPDVFQLDDEGLAIVVAGVSIDDRLDRLNLALMLCPTGAITLEEDA